MIHWGDRANEDWSYVDQVEDSEKSFVEQLKRLDLDESGDWKVSIAGNLRMLFDNRWNYMFNKDERIHNELRTRLYISADLSYQDKMRLFGEIRNNYSNLDFAGPIDDAGTDFHQLFAEFKLVDDESQRFSTRLGRQELSHNYWQLNNWQPIAVELAWDAASFNYQVNGFNFDAYYGEQVFASFKNGSFSGNWDDKSNGDKSMGLFASTQTKYGLMQAFIMSSETTNFAFVNADGGDVKVQSIGLHSHKFVREGFGHMVDGIYQFGDHAGKNISAYMGFLQLNYNWAKDMNYTLALNGHYASGTSKDSDEVNTFNPLWGGDVFGYAVDAAYSNAIQVGPSIKVEYLPMQSVTAGFLSTWRANTDDAIYSLMQRKVFSEESDQKYAYTNLYLQLHNYLAPTLKLEANMSYALDSKYTQDVVGQGQDSADVARVELILNYEF